MSDDLLKQWQDVKGTPVYLLFSGKDAQARDIYAYLSIPCENMLGFVTAINQGDAIELEDHATILYWNFGVTPPEEVQAVMKARHGFDHDYEVRLSEKLKLLKQA
ncbi:hypothetical protein GC177_01760 [bacterium]|nr:hypothetical protein [bacterium]